MVEQTNLVGIDFREWPIFRVFSADSKFISGSRCWQKRNIRSHLWWKKAEKVERCLFFERRKRYFIFQKIKFSQFSKFQKISRVQKLEIFRGYKISQITWTVRFRGYELSWTTKNFVKSRKIVPAKLSTNKLVLLIENTLG